MIKANPNRRMIITVAVILFAAIAGLMFINTEKAGAELSGLKNTDGAVVETGNSQMAESVVPSLFKIISALVVVLIAIYIGIYLLKKTMGQKFSGNKSKGSLEILETTFVAPKKSLSLVRVGNRSVLVGVTEQSISMLTELSGEETEQILAVESAQFDRKTQFNSFREMLTMASNKVKEFSQKGKPAAVKS